MSSYRNIEVCTVLNSGVMTGTNVLESNPLNIQSLTNAAFEMNWTGTAIGSFKIMVSLSGVNYSDLGVSISDTAGVDGTTVVNLYSLAVKYVKVRYTNASGTGVLNILGTARGI